MLQNGAPENAVEEQQSEAAERRCDQAEDPDAICCPAREPLWQSAVAVPAEDGLVFQGNQPSLHARQTRKERR